MKETLVATVHAQVPTWIKYDKQVLRFGAYMWEPAVSELEKPILKPLMIRHFLEDGTTEIIEQGSDMKPGKAFARRQVLYRPDSSGTSTSHEPFDHTSIAVGSDISVYARKIHVYSADEYTRGLLNRTGIKVLPDGMLPEYDDPSKNKIVRSRGPGVVLRSNESAKNNSISDSSGLLNINGVPLGMPKLLSERTFLRTGCSENKPLAENVMDSNSAKALANLAGLSPRSVNSTRSFHGYLSFLAVEGCPSTSLKDSLGSPYSSKFLIRHCTWDDEVEVTEMFTGESRGKKLLRKGPVFVQDSNSTSKSGSLPTSGSKDLTKSGLKQLGPRDYFASKSVTVHARQFSIETIDTATAEYLKSLGVVIPSGVSIKDSLTEIDESFKRPSSPSMSSHKSDANSGPHLPTPPHVMFGKPEDSILNVGSLMPRARKVDLERLMKDGATTLRFSAQLKSMESHGSNVDEKRKFVISVCPGDDSFMVYELEVPNSGFPSGKFSEKSKIRNPVRSSGAAGQSQSTSSQYYSWRDAKVGAQIVINGRTFLLSSCDQYTADYLTAHK